MEIVLSMVVRGDFAEFSLGGRIVCNATIHNTDESRCAYELEDALNRTNTLLFIAQAAAVEISRVRVQQQDDDMQQKLLTVLEKLEQHLKEESK